MAWVKILLPPTVNKPEFSSHRVESGFYPKYACFLARYLWFFPNTLLWIFGLFLSRLGYCTIFFLWCSPNFCTQRHMAVRLTQFPVLIANNSHNSTLVVSWLSATSALTSTSVFVRWLNCRFPFCLRCKFLSVCCCACFWRRLLRSSQAGGYFSHWHLLCQICCNYFLSESEEICFHSVWLQNDISLLFIVPSHSENRCKYRPICWLLKLNLSRN
jgi:hypothetical protein